YQPPNLQRCRADGAQQAQLAAPLDDGEAERVRDDEYGYEASDAAERAEQIRSVRESDLTGDDVRVRPPSAGSYHGELITAYRVGDPIGQRFGGHALFGERRDEVDLSSAREAVGDRVGEEHRALVGQPGGPWRRGDTADRVRQRSRRG